MAHAPIIETAQFGSSNLDAGIASRLRAVVNRIRMYVAVEGIARLVAFLAIAGLVQFAADYLTRGLRFSIRAAILGAVVVCACAGLWRWILSPLKTAISLPDAANILERRLPGLSSLLVSAVRFSSGQVGPDHSNSPALMRAVVSRANQELTDADFFSVLQPRRARRSGMALLLTLAVAAGALIAFPELATVWFSRNVLLSDAEWPRRTKLMVELVDGELVGARGDDLIVQAYAQGAQPLEVEFISTTESGKRGREMMTTVGSGESYRYRYTFKNASENFEFYLQGGDDVTESFRARLLERPRVEQSEIAVTSPAYTKLSPVTLRAGERTAQVLLGSTVSISIKANKPIREASLMSGQRVVAAGNVSGDRVEASIVPADTSTYYFALTDEAGLEDKRPTLFSIRVTRDDPPKARLKAPGVGEMITAEALLPLELEFSDAYGLASAELVFQIHREIGRDGLIPIEGFESESPTFSTSLNWPVSAEGLVAGDRLVLFARTSDFDNISGPNIGQSPELTFRVVTREELLSELARREQELRQDLERLIDGQEQVRSLLLTLINVGKTTPESEEFVGHTANVERRQRSIGGSLNVIRQQLEQILGEYRVNGLATQAVEQRLGDGVVEPLSELVKRDLVQAVEALRTFFRRPQELGNAEKADEQQVAILSRMRSILANLVEWEGYQEAVNMLRDILRLQSELKSETLKSAEEQGGGVFDD